MPLSDEYRAVLAAYPPQFQPRTAEFLAGAGGFSGAAIWRLESPLGPLCLRRWPAEHPSAEQLDFIHRVIRHVDQAGFRLVPVPIWTHDRASYVRRGGHLWELVPWLPGAADFHRGPSDARLRAAMTALAHFHRAAASFPHPNAETQISPGIEFRYRRVKELADGDLSRLMSFVRADDWPELAARAGQLCALFPSARRMVEASLAQAVLLQVPLEPCLRDIWHDHVLFLGDEVSGLIDFGAMRMESVAGDIARLLGSLAGDDARRWQLGLANYAAVRPLSSSEAALIPAFDGANVLLSGLNWIGWYYQDGRVFENTLAILDRIDQNLKRLRSLGGGGDG